MNPQKIVESVLYSLSYGAPTLLAYCVGLWLAYWLRSRNPAGSLTAILALSGMLIVDLMASVAYGVFPQVIQDDGEGIVGAMRLLGFIHNGLQGLGILALVGAIFQSRPNEAEAAADSWENSR